MSTNTKTLIILGIILLIIAIHNLTILFTPISTDKYIKNKIDIDISSCKIIEDEDTHGGFHGDGEYFVKADCKKSNDEILEQLSRWKSFPLSEYLQPIIYGNNEEELDYIGGLAAEKGIPKINNGLYYFADRYRGVAIETDGKEIFERASVNYTIAFYDKDLSMFYYYELDT